MSELAVREPAVIPPQLQPTPTPVVPPVAAPAPAVTAVETAAKPAAPAAADAAGILFSNYADGPGAPMANAPAAKPVKTTTIRPDASAMNNAIALGSDLTKAELPTARTTSGKILQEAGAAGVTNLNQIAYIMATARRESHMGNWMNEFGGNSYFEQHYGSKTKKGRELGNTEPTDGADFHGRGLVQITGRTNYTRWDDRLNKEGYLHDGQPVDLVNNPEQAADPHVAARIAVQGMRDGGFTRYKMDDFINDKGTDYLHARRVINGMDHAQEIATQAQRYQGILQNHSGEFTNAIQAAQMKDLPTAHDGGHLTAPSLTQQMLDPALMGSATSRFDSPHKLLKPNLGHFTAAPAPTKLTTLKTKPAE